MPTGVKSGWFSTQPVIMRNMFSAYGKARATTSVTFVSKLAYENGIKEKLGLEKMVLPVMNCRTVGKKNMILNDKTPIKKNI